MPGDQPQARPGVAAIEDAVGRPEAVRARARRPGSRPFARRSRDPLAPSRPSAATMPGRRADVLAVAGAADPALAGGERGEEQRPVADRLVAGQAQLAAQARRRVGPSRRRARGRGGDRTLNAGSALVRPHRRPRRRSRGAGSCAWRDELVDRDDRGHHRAELVEVELLLGVGQRRVRVRVDLDHDPVGPDRDAAQRQRRDQPALAGGVARVDDDRQVRQVVERAARPPGPSCCGCTSRTSGCRARTGSRSGCRS